MQTHHPGLPQPQRRWAIITMSLGTALVVVDNAIATVALPTIADALDVSAASVVSVVTVYQMVLLMALLPLSALGDMVGHKRLYQGGQMIFLGATLLCFLAASLPVLLVARACQALGVAAVLSVSSAMLRRIYPSDRLGRGLGLNSIIIASAAALAPTIGGLILSLGSWRSIFAAAAPFALLCLLLGRALPDPAPSRAAFDLPGAAMCALMFGTLVGGLQSGVHEGASALTLMLICAGAVTAALFVRRERGRANPILPVDLLGRPVFALATMAALTTFASFMCFTLSLPFRLQGAYGLSPAETGAVMAAWPLAMMAMAPVAGALSDRAPGGLLGCIGMAMAATSFLLIAFLPAEAPGFFGLVAPLLLGGAGAGLFIAPNSHLIMRSAPPERSASAGAMISTTRLVGSALGALLLAALLSLGAGEGPIPPLLATGCAVVSALCCLGNLLSRSRSLDGDGVGT